MQSESRAVEGRRGDWVAVGQGVGTVVGTVVVMTAAVVVGIVVGVAVTGARTLYFTSPM